LRRRADDPNRRAHADPATGADEADFLERFRTFDRVDVGTLSMETDTSDGYRPPLADLLAFLAGGPH
jgi:hypothetical protein